MQGERLPQAKTQYLDDEEVLIVFMDEAHGVAFREYWRESGSSRFWAWYEAHKDLYEV